MGYLQAKEDILEHIEEQQYIDELILNEAISMLEKKGRDTLLDIHFVQAALEQVEEQ